MPKKLTTEEFIRRSIAKFPGQFSYRTTAYADATTKVEIGCTQHELFHVLPSVHLREMGRGGCARCAGNARITTAEFIALATKVHSGRYDYARAGYMGAKLKVEIVCPQHGVFFQAGSEHLGGKGCPKCADDSREGVWSASLPARAEKFVAGARAVHGDKYDYTLVAYQRSTGPVKILCPEHGPFHQSPGSHLRGRGCPKCGLRAGGLVRRVGTQELIQRAREVHGGRYDYSLTSYETTHKPVVITCAIHGPFKQDPSNHLTGKGCKRCAMFTNAKTIIARRGSDIVEAFRAVHGDFYGYDKVI